MGRLADKTGERFGRLLITGKNVERSGRNTYWNYVCDCGSTGATATSKLNSGQVSCGCHTRELIGELNRSHGHATGGVVSATYRCHRAMIARCMYPSQVHYPDYGGRGIKVCDRWLNGDGGLTGFECFLADMGEKPRGLTIDRIDNDGNYEPGNCRWVTQKENCRNTRATKLDVDSVRAIRDMHAAGKSQVSIARCFGVSQTHVSDVVRHAVW